VLGWALVALGKKEQGLAQTHAGLAALRATGAGIWQSQFLALLASAYEETGQIQEGLRAIAEALAAAERNGERFYEAELHRMRGELTLAGTRDWGLGTSSSPQAPSLKPQVPKETAQEAERCFHKAIEIAREQQAKSWELRAAMSLARLWQSQDKRSEARALLEDIYSWFTEGFDTKDLREAEALLIALGGKVERTEGGRREAEEVRRKAGDGKGEAENVRLKASGPPLFSPSSLQPEAYNLSSPPTSSTQHFAVFRCEGEYWTVGFQGTVARIKDTRGMQYLARLLQYPHQEFSALALAADNPVPDSKDLDVTAVHGLGFTDAGEVVDPQAKHAYQQRLKELQAELDEARTFHDMGRVEKLQAEIEFLTQELIESVGLSGRTRKAASSTERARVNVTRAIRTAIARIVEMHPALGQYMTRTIKTGTFCMYAPEQPIALSWQF
jgi:tetratricopeptide (TPR) repeat protein